MTGDEDRESTIVTMIEHHAEIRPVAPYDFELLLTYLRSAPLASLEQIGANSYQRALRLDGRDVLLTLRSVGTPMEPILHLAVTGHTVRSETVSEASATLRRAFNLDADPSPYFAHVAQYPVLGALALRWAGIRPVLLLDPFEALLWAVLGQQINVGFARRLKGVLVELCGQELRVKEQVWPIFPMPEQVAELDVDALTSRQFSKAKARYVVDLSVSVASGELDLAAIGALPREEALTELTRYRGIGRWTAEYLLMRVYGDTDAMPAGDVSLHRIIGEAVVGTRVTEAELRALAEPWTPWRGWAAFTFWINSQLGRVSTE